MKPAPLPTSTTHRLRRIGCVSYLNAKPLIDGLDRPGEDLAVRYDVPSRLLTDLEAGDVDIALCPVIDYCRSRHPLTIVPVGGIGCEGSTLTVRLYSRVPIDQITTVHVDMDSHTSVTLLRVLLDRLYGIVPRLIDYDAHEQVARGRGVEMDGADAPEAMLLIGDKVVTDSPKAVMYPYQLDLGEAWHRATEMPFVFAVWMVRSGDDFGDLPARLARQRDDNAGRIDDIVEKHAAAHGWPSGLAREYLGHTLRYAVRQPELEAIERFYEMARDVGAIDAVDSLRVYGR